MRRSGGFATLPSRVLLATSIFIIVNAPIAANEMAHSVEAETATVRHLMFDIPSQPLASALEAYGAISGFQVIYDAGLAKGRVSSEIKGEFSPDEALRRLLNGTGLTPRYMAADGVGLVSDPGAGLVRNTAQPREVALYYGRIQTRLRQVFCAEPGVHSGVYRFAIGLWIGSAGFVVRSGLLDTTGNPELDARLEGALRGMSIGEAPPVGFAQPVVMTVGPDVTRECQAIVSQRVAP